MSTIRFQDRKASVDFYQDRYEHGYMGHWSGFDKERLTELVRSLSLPEKGKALDFGCGRGIFTEVIREALPGWTVFGCDISREAVRFASENNKKITFFVLGDEAYAQHRFDFIHSHHVLEHTYDEKITAGEMSAFAADRCVMLHSLPCKEPGSLEYNLSTWTNNGMDAANGKFFFEDTAHLRRLTASGAEALFAPYRFRAVRKYFANRKWGAIRWIAESNFGLVWGIADPLRAVSASAFFRLLYWRIALLFYWFCFFAASAFQPADKGRYYSVKKILQAVSFILFFWIALPVRSLVLSKARKEWDTHKDSPDGTDLFLVIQR